MRNDGLGPFSCGSPSGGEEGSNDASTDANIAGSAGHKQIRRLTGIAKLPGGRISEHGAVLRWVLRAAATTVAGANVIVDSREYAEFGRFAYECVRF
ncbi:MAG TPA: hypothetical protein VGC19_11790 [Rhodanobacter sp.]